MAETGSWRVLADDALDRWQIDSSPGEDQVAAVLGWLLHLVEQGPPDEDMAVPYQEDLYLGRVSGHKLVIEYLALAHERLAVVRRIALSRE